MAVERIFLLIQGLLLVQVGLELELELELAPKPELELAPKLKLELVLLPPALPQMGRELVPSDLAIVGVVPLLIWRLEFGFEILWDIEKLCFGF